MPLVFCQCVSVHKAVKKNQSIDKKGHIVSGIFVAFFWVVPAALFNPLMSIQTK